MEGIRNRHAHKDDTKSNKKMIDNPRIAYAVGYALLQEP